MTPVEPPYSLELGPHEALKDATPGLTSAVVSGKMKIFIGSDVNTANRQSIVGSLKVCFRRVMEDKIRGAYADNIVVHGDALSARSGNVVISSSTSGIGTDEVAIIIASTFGHGLTHMADETFNQLIGAFLQNTAGT